MLRQYANETGVIPVPFEELVYLVDEARYEEKGKVPSGAKIASISGTQVREDYLAKGKPLPEWFTPVSYTHLRAHETVLDSVCRLLLETKKEDHL